MSDRLTPSLFPKVWDASMNLVYEKNMVNPDTARQRGIVHYASSLEEGELSDRIGDDPLRIVARRVFGKNRTDPVISRDDALKILTDPANRKLLLDSYNFV